MTWQVRPAQYLQIQQGPVITVWPAAAVDDAGAFRAEHSGASSQLSRCWQLGVCCPTAACCTPQSHLHTLPQGDLSSCPDLSSFTSCPLLPLF
jgi:hypothetical protein